LFHIFRCLDKNVIFLRACNILPHLTQRIGVHVHFTDTAHGIDLTSGAHLSQASGSSWTADGTGFGGHAGVYAIGEVVEMVAIVGKWFVIR